MSPNASPRNSANLSDLRPPHPIRAPSLCFCVVVFVVCFFDCVRHFWAQAGEICRLSQLFAPEILQGFPIYWGPPTNPNSGPPLFLCFYLRPSFAFGEICTRMLPPRKFLT